MGKKRTSSVAIEEQAPTTGKDTLNEIDEIFVKAKKRRNVQGSNPSGSSRLKNDERDEQDVNPTSEAKDKKKKKKSKKNEKDCPETPSNSRRRTNDGFCIYSADEIGFNKKSSGGTALCPFDCDCCF